MKSVIKGFLALSAMTLCCTSAQNMASLHQRKLGVFSLLATPAYSLKTWGKAAIKKAFKSVAKKMLGPIGALIAVSEFSYCMWG